MKHIQSTSTFNKVIVATIALLIQFVFAGKSIEASAIQVRLFPVSGVTISKTTMNQIKSGRRQCAQSSCSIDNVSFYDANEDGLIDSIYLTKLDSIPKEWKKQGLNWRLSYKEWIRILANSGFKILAESKPLIAIDSGRFYLSAELSALSPNQDYKVALNFSDGNLHYDGYGLNSKNSLFSISISLVAFTKNAKVTENQYFDWIEYECKRGLYGVKSLQGDSIIGCKYSSIERVDNEYKLMYRDLFDCNIEDHSKLCNDTISWFYKFAYIVKSGGKYGVIDILGKEVIPIQYDSLFWMNGWYKVKKNSFIGALDQSGSMILPIKFNDVSKSYPRDFVVKQHNKYGVVDSLGREVLPLDYDAIDYIYRGHKVKQNKKYGVLDSNWATLVPINYDSIESDYPGYIIKLNGLYGVLDSSWHEIISPQFDAIKWDHPGYIVKKNKLVGRYSKSGTEICAPIYSVIKEVYPNFLVKQNGKYGYIDTLGKILIPSKYDSIYESYPGFRVIQNGRIGMYSKSGIQLMPAIYDSIRRDYPNYWVIYNGKWGVLDSNGSQIVKVKYDTIIEKHPGYLVKQNGKYGKLSSAGDELISVKYDTIVSTYPGYQVIVDGKYGKLDSLGNEVIEPKFDTIFNAYPGYFVKLNGRYGLFDKIGKEIIAPKYDTILSKYFGFVVEKNGKQGLFDSTGKQLIPSNFDRVENKFLFFKIEDNGRVGAYGLDGSLLVPCEFEDISILKEKYILAKLGEGRALYDLNGSQIVPLSKRGVEKYFGLKLEGDWSVSINGASHNIKINGAKINNNSLNGKSGTLLINAYLMDDKFDGKQLSGYNIASVKFDPLEANYYYHDISKQPSLSVNPPSGDYYVSIILSEYTDNGFVIRDFLNFPNKVSYDDHRTEMMLNEVANSLNELNNSLQMINGTGNKNSSYSGNGLSGKNDKTNRALDRQKAFSQKQVESYKKHDKNQYDYYMRLYNQERSEADSYFRLYERSKDLDDLEKSKDCENRAKDYLEKANIWK